MLCNKFHGCPWFSLAVGAGVNRLAPILKRAPRENYQKTAGAFSRPAKARMERGVRKRKV